MAKKVKEENVEVQASKATNFLKKFRETNKLASVLSESKLSNITDYISSGCYTLNKVISGSYFKGFPNNKIIILAGASSVGKSFLCLSTAREAQKKGYQVVYFDSENAIDSAFAKNLGVNPETLIHIPVKSISQFRNEAVKFMRAWREDEETKKLPLIMFCDSIGGLAGSKEMADVEAEKSASDMGQRAKELRACARILTMECAENEVPLICTNHTYEQQNMMAAPTIKMSGGEGFVYATSGIIILQGKAVKEVEGKDSEGRVITNKQGALVIATSEKNRMVPSGVRGYAYIDFKRGVSPYYGLLDDAMKYGFIQKGGAWYTIKDKDGNEIKKVQEKNLYTKDIWQPILKDLDEKLVADLTYSVKTDEEVNFGSTDGDDPVLDENEETKD